MDKCVLNSLDIVGDINSCLVMAFASEPVDLRFSHLALLNDNGSLFYATKILNSERETDKLVQRYVGICSALNDTTMSKSKDNLGHLLEKTSWMMRNWKFQILETIGR